MTVPNHNIDTPSDRSDATPSETQPDILIVDDTPENLRLLTRMLTKRGYKVRQAKSGIMALQAVAALPPDLILLDIMMPGMDGYEVCQHLKANPQSAEIPVIFLSSLNGVLDKVKAFQMGGADYISKPFQLEEVISRVQNQLVLVSAQRQIRQLNAELEARVRRRTAQLERANQHLQREIEEHQRTQEVLIHMAFHDALTKLPNRALFLEKLYGALARLQADASEGFAVLLLDCDRFKVVNNSLGYSVGDELLKAIGQRLGSALGERDTLARLGGDEFAILLDGIGNLDRAVGVAEDLLSEFSKPFHLRQHEVYINASVGIVLGAADYEQPEDLLRDADTALYRAKALGKGQYHIFDPELHQFAIQRLQLETDLRRSLNDRGFMVYYQPIVALSTGKLAGFEALVRWQHPTRGLVSPAEFIPVAEETGLIRALGIWVLEEACDRLRTWQQQGVGSDLTMSINLAVQQLLQRNLLDQIDRLLADTQLDPRCLKLEITESALMENGEAAIAILHQLRSRGIQLSIDDFGTGYSSLSYLHRLPVNTLKIDRSFVKRMDGKSGNMGLVPAIINMAHTMGISAIAEGVETPQQFAQLQNLHCDFGQGYLFGVPLNCQLATELLQSQPRWRPQSPASRSHTKIYSDPISAI
ncbi:MAG TPA: EAL domain-containing protein [Oscillatoriales cyanobacterium M59_W2019_021]|nr:MAG: EAL domain-containing response regulator [Cyanobacteria bacterium J055]HIK29844.1 EAL domain-containing protein [Oscillatoriales cyanobacterium M4454_W2019_049]HIK50314.1 EAL domain-containing protein [Oscillatoriales cyanobacterium M59_W2019_021]